MIIPLGQVLPSASSDRTRRHRASNPYPTASHVGRSGRAFLFGLAPGGVYQAPDVTTGTGALLPHRFTLTRSQRVAVHRSTRHPGGFFSVALSLGLPPLDVIQHPALWSPDFPPRRPAVERSPRRSSPPLQCLLYGVVCQLVGPGVALAPGVLDRPGIQFPAKGDGLGVELFEPRVSDPVDPR